MLRRVFTSALPFVVAFVAVAFAPSFGRVAAAADAGPSAAEVTTRRLLAVIGPSGVGKTSFLRAGLLATPGWRRPTG